ncbi:MAG: hypothetical protein WCS30_09310 [Selenomonadaceae bacterium]
MQKENEFNEQEEAENIEMLRIEVELTKKEIQAYKQYCITINTPKEKDIKEYIFSKIKR